MMTISGSTIKIIIASVVESVMEASNCATGDHYTAKFGDILGAFFVSFKRLVVRL